MEEKTLYERLGGVFAIAAVVDRFSDEIIKDPIAGQGSQNPDLREWHTKQLGRLPGLKFMRTLWVSAAAGGPFNYIGTKPGQTQMGMEKAHFDLHISPDEFAAVANILAETLDYFHVPEKEKNEVLGAFSAHKDEVTTGYYEASKQ
ncbi:group I truncated hemoglobin [Trichococcus alkaliphilus]|uniref:group I truncated hemoglobin n=1 Tax=Trichococcus alkaliphilus TaxID=2052943 RepID=UPI000D0B1948|nr:group 1 truncated hemoglobin [Trichococcus alkaliphilus]